MDVNNSDQQRPQQPQQKSSPLSSSSPERIIESSRHEDVSNNSNNNNHNLAQSLDAMTIGAAAAATTTTAALSSNVDDNRERNAIPPSPAAVIIGEHPSAATTTATQTTITTTPSLVMQERENFLIFIKILFKILDDNSTKEPHTKAKAKHIVLECRRRNTLGDPNYTPLMDAVEIRLKRFIGESIWMKAHILLHHYITKHRPAQRSRINNNMNAKQQQQSIPVMVGGGKQS